MVVEADWEQIQQLLLNLALNAIDVMSEGGTLEVEVCPPVDGRVQLRVLDSGPGISRDVMAKLFEPFVTTKETGVGLGLVVSRRIAEDHEIAIWLDAWPALIAPAVGELLVVDHPRAGLPTGGCIHEHDGSKGYAESSRQGGP